MPRPYSTSRGARCRGRQPRTLTDDEVYALTAYILAINKLIGENDVMNAQDAAEGEDAEPRQLHHPVSGPHLRMSASNTVGPVLWDVDPRGVATVTLNRPEVNNAYNGELIQGLLAALDALGGAPGLRAVVIQGNGRHFQAGADLKWIDAVRTSSAAENVRVSRATAEAVARLNHVPVPTIALVQGGCFGGGTGLVAACDVAIAADNATFSIAEVRWGLTAAIIVPQLNDAIGVRQLRRYGLTGERFNAEEARRIGLVHEVVPLAELAAAGERVVGHVLENGPRRSRRPRR